MPDANLPALNFLLSRQSRPAKTFTLPVPSRDELSPLLTAAARVPDHGKLEPWRFLVLEKPALKRLADLAEQRAKELGLDDEKIAKGRGQFDAGLLAVAVVSSPKPSEKIPEIEQVLSAGAVCFNLLTAATAAGWGANWLSGWPSYDREFIGQGLGLAPHETVAGIVHIGTAPMTPPDRPRPDIARLTTWVDA
ncbi:MAG: nitroreductase [Cereibacter sphaeroides]|uniref:Putative NAD(P)H nitroreductase n=1 Tax=Cereibacter sphaeroides TaxID=1063 RepID=A0A2W5RYV7_CERSP|nr:MAG: nitroreductase [Cereibacter sphaeroides]